MRIDLAEFIMTKEELDRAVAAPKANYERLKKLIDDKADDPLKKTTPGFGAQDWTQCWNASNALHTAENKAITDKYDPLIESARQRGDKLRDELKALSDQYQKKEMTYEQYKEKDEAVRRQIEVINAEFDAARSARSKALNESFERANQRLDQLKGHALKPPEEPTKDTKVGVKSEHMEKILEDYNKKFNSSWYKEHPPHEKDGKQFLPFENATDMVNFCKDQAQKKS